MTMPTWFSEVQAFGGPAVALGAVAIAAQQYRLSRQQHSLARQKLRLDLYPKRYAVYVALLDAISIALNGQYESTLDRQTLRLNRRIREARFLFDPETFTYLSGLETRILQYRSIHGSLKKGPDEASAEDWQHRVTWHSEMSRWFLNQTRELPKRLRNHLQIDDEVGLTAQGSDGRIEPPPPDL